MRLLALASMDKLISKPLKELKERACAELMEDARNGKSDSAPLSRGGLKFGGVRVCYTADGIGIVPGHEYEALKWLEAAGLTEPKPIKGWERRFTVVGGEVVDTETGEAVEWAIPAPSVPSYAKVTIDKPLDALRSFRMELGDGGIYGFLEG